MKRILDLRKLRNLVALADAGNFVRAATLVNLSQPAFSRSIQALEAEIGAALVERRQGTLQLSVVGELVVRDARQLLQTAARLHEDARLWAGGEAGDLTIGMGPMTAALLGAFALRCINKARPAAHLSLVVADAPSLQTRLRNLELEFFIASRANFDESPELSLIQFATIPLGLLVRREHPLLRLRSLSSADLANYPLAYGTRFSEHPGDSDNSNPQLICDNYHILREMVSSSNAVWLSSPLLAKTDLGSPLCELPHPRDRWYPDRTELVVGHLASRELSPLAIAALNCLRGWTEVVPAHQGTALTTGL